MSASARRKRSKNATSSAATISTAPSSADPAAPYFVARLVPLEPGLYAVGLAEETGWRGPAPGLALPAVQLCAPPHEDGGIEITDSSGGAGSWLGGRHRMLFVKAPAGGGTALVTGYLARDPNSLPLELEIRRLAPSDLALIAAGGDSQPATMPALATVMTLRMGAAVAAEQSPQPVGLDIVAHIRGRGDVRFVDSPWVGRLGPGLWIEGFMILPHSRLAAGGIEYKGLTASGAETPWIGGGALCGTQGRGTPLIGFAVRQKAVAGGAGFDCEYTGYFQSGATVGPTRNGAPCRSATDNDPLEGMQLRITPRAPRPASTKTA